MKQWQLADLMGISEFYLSRLFRKELPDEEQDKIVQIINNAKGDK